jgi:hypothetical protein
LWRQEEEEGMEVGLMCRYRHSDSIIESNCNLHHPLLTPINPPQAILKTKEIFLRSTKYKNVK